jgi:hypothetical protein
MTEAETAVADRCTQTLERVTALDRAVRALHPCIADADPTPPHGILRPSISRGGC